MHKIYKLSNSYWKSRLLINIKRCSILDGEQDGRGVGECGIHLSLRIHQEHTFKHRSACRTPAENRQEYLTSRKKYIDPCKTWYDEGTRGKNRSVSRNGPARWGNWSRALVPTSGQLSESEEKHLRLKVKELICASLSGMRIRQSLLQPRQKCRSPRRCTSWELEFRDCGAILGWGLLSTVERWIKVMWGRRLWWEMPVEESQAVMEARWYYWVMCRGWSHHLIASPYRRTSAADIKEAGLSSAWGTEVQSRTPPRVLL